MHQRTLHELHQKKHFWQETPFLGKTVHRNFTCKMSWKHKNMVSNEEYVHP